MLIVTHDRRGVQQSSSSMFRGKPNRLDATHVYTCSTKSEHDMSLKRLQPCAHRDRNAGMRALNIVILSAQPRRHEKYLLSVKTYGVRPNRNIVQTGR